MSRTKAPPPACAPVLYSAPCSALKQTRVTGVELTDFGVEIDVAPTTRVAYCSACLRRAKHVYDHRPRTWRHLDFAGMEVTLKYRQRRVDCRHCHEVHTELVPWSVVPKSGVAGAGQLAARAGRRGPAGAAFALRGMKRRAFDEMNGAVGRPSIPPVRILRSTLLMAVTNPPPKRPAASSRRQDRRRRSVHRRR